MNKDGKILLTEFVILVSIIIGAMLGYKIGHSEGYVEACGDFYGGSIKMELVADPNGTREWKVKK